VYVSFSIREREGRPSDVTIAASSGFERLDRAAMRSLERSVVRTSCPGVQYRLRVSFRLDEFGRPMEPDLAAATRPGFHLRGK
jgi:TonB family protein